MSVIRISGSLSSGIRWLSAFLFGSLLLMACGSIAADTSIKSVRIAAVAYFDAGKPVFAGTAAVIAEQGWLAQELNKRGIALEWVPAPSANVGPIINESFANQSIDFAAYGDLPSIILNAGGVNTRLIVPNGRGMDTYLVVPVNSTAKTIRDLKGKRIAIHRGRPWELPFIHLLEANGLSYRDFKILNLNPVAGAAAVASGNVDAMYTLSDALLLEDKHVGKIIWSTRDAPADWKMRAELWASKQFIDRYPELTQLVATAYIKALYWTAQTNNFEAVIKLGARSGAPESVVRREYEDGASWKDRWSPLFNESIYTHYQNAANFAFANNLIRNAIDTRRLIDPQFTTRALHDLRLEYFWGTDVANYSEHQP